MADGDLTRLRPRRAPPAELDDVVSGGGRPARAPKHAAPLRIGLLLPQSGPIGMFGPSSLNCAILAAKEINHHGGILGRAVELVIGDGGGTASEIVEEAERMIAEDGVQAVVGSHISTNRVALVRAIGGRVPYVYTTLYEGGEYSFGVFLCGETPDQQARPLVHWLARNKGVRRWYMIGNDYVFPRTSIARAKRFLSEVECRVVGEEYTPFFVRDFHSSLQQIAASKADAVLIYLVGEDSIVFNRQFAAVGLDQTTLRAAPVLCENALLGIGPQATRDLYSATGFSDCMDSRPAGAFRNDYRRSFGRNAPIPNRFGVSCYEGLHLLAALARRAKSLDTFKLQAVSDGTALHGPRGECQMMSNHLSTPMHIAMAAGMDFRPIAPLGTAIAPPPTTAIWYPRDGGSG